MAPTRTLLVLAVLLAAVLFSPSLAATGSPPDVPKGECYSLFQTFAPASYSPFFITRASLADAQPLVEWSNASSLPSSASLRICCFRCCVYGGGRCLRCCHPPVNCILPPCPRCCFWYPPGICRRCCPP